MYGSPDMECNRQNILPFCTIFCPFTPLTTQKIKIWKNEKNIRRYYLFTHVYHKWQSYEVWFLRYQAGRTEFFVIVDHFLQFYPHKTLNNQNFEKLKKTQGDIIILQKCTKNHDHMVYYSLDMARNRVNWAIFYPSTSLTVQKIQFWKNLEFFKN